MTPVWNDATRLERFGASLATALRDSGLDVCWVIADDGSSASEKARLETLRSKFAEVYPNVELVTYEVRSRKGGAIFSTWTQYPDARYLAFVDADGAVSAEAMVDLLDSAAMSADTLKSYIAIRDLSGDTGVERSVLRKCSFYGFSFFVRSLTGLEVRDSQCGAKVISGAAFRMVEKELFERGYIFDVELLLALKRHGCPIEERPIPWQEMPGSKVSLIRDVWAMLLGLMRIRRRLSASVD